MRKKIYLPKSAEELKKLNHQKQAELWARYHNSPYERQFRALWYYNACEIANLKIELKHLTKLEIYAEIPDECMVKVYKTKYNLHPGTGRSRDCGNAYLTYPLSRLHSDRLAGLCTLFHAAIKGTGKTFSNY